MRAISTTSRPIYCRSSRGGECTSLLGPGEPYTPNSEKDTSCLGPVEPYAPSTHISELIVLAHIGKKREPKGRPTTLAGPGSPFRYTRWLERT